MAQELVQSPNFMDAIHDTAQFFYNNLKKAGMIDENGISPWCRLRYKTSSFDGFLFHVDPAEDDTHLIRICRYAEAKNPEQPSLCLKFDAKNHAVTAIAQERIVRNRGKISISGSEVSDIGDIGEELIDAVEDFKRHEPHTSMKPEKSFRVAELDGVRYR